MPKVGNKSFAYTKEGMKKAKSYAEKEGKEMKMSKKGYMKHEASEYKMKGKKKK